MTAINRQIVLAERPYGAPTEQTFRTEEVPVPTLNAGEVLIRTIYLSWDPWQSDGRTCSCPCPIEQLWKGVVGKVLTVTEVRSG